MVGVEGGVWVGIDRYDNDGVPSDAKYTVLACVQYHGQGGHTPAERRTGVFPLGQYESYDTELCHTTYGTVLRMVLALEIH